MHSIARHGVRFTAGYASAPLCSPTRAGLMTGRYQQRFGHEFNKPDTIPDEDFGLARAETTLADRLKALGYATGLVGKWHLGLRPGAEPAARGFDEFFGFMRAMHGLLSDSAAGSTDSARFGSGRGTGLLDANRDGVLTEREFSGQGRAGRESGEAGRHAD